MATTKAKVQKGKKTAAHALTIRIVVGMVAGLGLGLTLNALNLGELGRLWITNGVLDVVGQIFVASLKLLVVPLVFVSIVTGTAALDDIKRLGRVGGLTMAYYMATTAIAIALAIGAALLIRPGVGFELTSNASFSVSEAPSLAQTIIDIFPSNPIRSMAEGNMLQIIVFAILFGVALTLSGSAGSALTKTFQNLNEVIMKMVMILMRFAPYGVFALIAKVFAEQGFGAFVPLLAYFFTVLLVLALHFFGTYSVLIRFFARLSPIQFFKNVREVPVVAFSTASSNATLPITLETAELNLGIKPSISSFTIPLGATINMDGTAIMQGVATVFISQAYGIEIGLTGYLMVILTATLASVGTAGVPGVGLITLAMVLRQVNLPVEGIALIIGVDRLLDMVRTAVNVTGDAAVSLVVAKAEGEFDQKVFDSDPVI